MIDSSTAPKQDTRQFWIFWMLFFACVVSDSERLIFWLSVMHYESAGPFLPPSLRIGLHFLFNNLGGLSNPALPKDRSLTANWADTIWLTHFRSSTLHLHRSLYRVRPGRELWLCPLPQEDPVCLDPTLVLCTSRKVGRPRLH